MLPLHHSETSIMNLYHLISYHMPTSIASNKQISSSYSKHTIDLLNLIMNDQHFSLLDNRQFNSIHYICPCPPSFYLLTLCQIIIYTHIYLSIYILIHVIFSFITTFLYCFPLSVPLLLFATKHCLVTLCPLPHQ